MSDVQGESVMRFLSIALAATAAFAASAHAAEPSKVDPAFLPYEKPGVFAKLANGQTIHIKCMGEGSPTVILTAGLGDWSGAWRKVQPEIARTTRACAWDRPGFGFSSGTSRPQTVLDTTADLEAALKLAKIRGPYIAVGHSLGGYESLLFKDHNPGSVVGMVLVDPSIPDQQRRFRKAAPAMEASFAKFHADQASLLHRCLAGLRSGKLKIGGPDPDGCLGFPPEYPAPLTAALARRDTNPLRFTAFISLSENFDRDGTLVMNPKRDYGTMPLIVLTAADAAPLPDQNPAAVQAMPQLMKEFSKAHDEIAALSTRGVNRTIAHSTHYIQYDQPQAVIDAIKEVVAAVRSPKQ